MASSVRYRPTCTCVEIAPLWRTPSDPTRTNINPRRRNQTQVGSYLMMHEGPIDHPPRRFRAAPEEAGVEGMRAMRAETYRADWADPAQADPTLGRSHERRGGKECVHPGRT